MNISESIRARARAQGKKQSDLYRFLGISDRQWRTWMRYPEQYLTLGRIKVIATLLHTTAGELLREGET